ncbi:mannosyltransferase [Salinimicrobium sp. GXAS 041]|uniref:mannosyltransferase n=1 Tax=Salinimicrobium sp. GXAS 041 TaxID=3400806 RepID=UPI003C77295C
MEFKQIKYHKFPLLLLFSCCALYFSFAYDLVREDFIKLVSLYTALFFLSWKFFQLEKFNLKMLFWSGIVFRLLFLFALPNLSQDFYRFIWDGKLLLHDFNPYLSTPEELISSGKPLFEGARKLYDGMGVLSAGNHSNYPPINQFIFALSGFFSQNSLLGAVIFLRLIIIAADIGIFYFGRKLLKSLKLPENRIFWYFLSPFIIIELTGNLHFEGVMILFIISSLYMLQRQKWLFSAALLACAVSVKLIPLLFLPLFFRRLGFKNAIGYYLIVAAINITLFLPFLSPELLSNYLQTVGLWFQKFEFNASIYYLIRWVGYQVEGYNILVYTGKPLAAAVFLSIVGMAFFRRNKSTAGLITTMLFGITVYYALATTVHPWYVAVPAILCIFTNYRFPLLWSLLVVLSYAAYSNDAYRENLWLIAVEYLIIYAVMGYEIYRNEWKPNRKIEAAEFPK